LGLVDGNRLYANGNRIRNFFYKNWQGRLLVSGGHYGAPGIDKGIWKKHPQTGDTNNRYAAQDVCKLQLYRIPPDSSRSKFPLRRYNRMKIKRSKTIGGNMQNRVIHIEKEFIINAPAETVFPLTCPFGEYKWIPSWNFELVRCPNE